MYNNNIIDMLVAKANEDEDCVYLYDAIVKVAAEMHLQLTYVQISSIRYEYTDPMYYNNNCD